MKTALTIAGSDTIGGAGIQADIKTMMAHGVYAMSVITALTAQNTLGVTGIMEVTPDFLKQEIDAVFTDIFPDAVKIGMVADKELIKVIADKLTEYKARNIVVDTVMVASTRARLIKDEAVDYMCRLFFPLATVITPNIPEASVIADMDIKSETDMEKAAFKIYDTYGCPVLVKGGHEVATANDFLICQDGERWYQGKRIQNENTHGTGCTLSSAIASNLAKGYNLMESIEMAKEYISGALRAGLNLGNGSGPLNHGYELKYE